MFSAFRDKPIHPVKELEASNETETINHDKVSGLCKHPLVSRWWLEISSLASASDCWSKQGVKTWSKGSSSEDELRLRGAYSTWLVVLCLVAPKRKML